MTHAIYIAVILALFVYAYWRNGQLEDAREDLKDAQLDARSAEDVRDAQREHANKWRVEAQKLRDEAILLTSEREDWFDKARSLEASNRSLRGWNGRYRRRIAELEAELAQHDGSL